jgi:hypothetical protein
MEPNSAGHRVTIGGSADKGQIVVGGDHNTQIDYGSVGAPPPGADVAELRRTVDDLVAQLRAQITAEAPDEKRTAALERVDELRDAVLAEEPEPTTIDYVRRWFSRNLPKLAGAVTGLIINPVVGQVVAAAGELAAGEFRRLFGAERAE